MTPIAYKRKTRKIVVWFKNKHGQLRHYDTIESLPEWGSGYRRRVRYNSLRRWYRKGWGWGLGY